MPRISVDIDLTYLAFEDRESSLRNIEQALSRIRSGIQNLLPSAQLIPQYGKGKLQISYQGSQIKMEVNLTNRGTLLPPDKRPLCEKAQEEFDAFADIPVVSSGQLYGGKICATLDRQHPRDLFDIKYLLDNEEITEEIKIGFLLCLLSSDRPISEVLNPHLKDQRLAMRNQFEGMSSESFSYEDYEETRGVLIRLIHETLEEKDRRFLLNFKNINPDWALYDFQHFPAIQWKLKNLLELKQSNPAKHTQLYESLQRLLGL